MAWTLRDVAAEEGLKYAQRASQISPENTMILDTLGMLYLETGNTKSDVDSYHLVINIICINDLGLNHC